MPFNAEFVDDASRTRYFIPIYALDTHTTIIERLASAVNTVPKLLVINDLNIQSISSRRAPVLYTNMTVIFEKASTFRELYENIDKEAVPLLRMITYYVVLNEKLGGMFDKERDGVMDPDYGTRPILASLEAEIARIDPNERYDVDSIWTQRDAEIARFDKDIELNRNLVQKTDREYSAFDVSVGIQYTDFSIERVTNKYEYRVPSTTTVLELFNNVRLGNEVVFAASHDFYKVQRDSVPSLLWLDLFDSKKLGSATYRKISSKEGVILQVSGGTGKDKSTTAVTIKKGDKLGFETIVDINYSMKNKDKILGIVSEATGGGTFSEEGVLDVRGVFYIANQTMNKYILSDLILVDPLFSSIMAIKENPIRTVNNVRIYFHTGQIGNITAEVSQQKRTRATTELPEDKFPVGSFYVKVKVDRASNLDKVRDFQKVLSKLFVVYNNKESEIAGFYKSVGRIDFSEAEDDEDDEESGTQNLLLELRKAEPAIFQVGYTRKCRRPVTIVTDQEAEEASRQGKQVLVYPPQPMGGATPRKYVCNHEIAKYPGLRDNPFSNNKELPFIPCCFETDQSNVVKDTNTVKAMKYSSYKSHVIIPPDTEGVLPENIEAFFHAMNPEYEYKRLGSLRNPSSFLYCVLLALNKVPVGSNQEQVVREAREYFVDPKHRNIINTCLQEQYDKTPEQIVDDLKDPNVYMDPSLFVHLLETRYQVDIYIFSKVHSQEGEMIVPRHSNGYFKTRNKFESICVFEHLGSDSESASYPQCELIVQKTGSKLYNYNYPHSSAESKVLLETFTRIDRFYVGQRLNTPVLFDMFYNPKVKPVSQVVDAYGKTRRLNLQYSLGLPNTDTDVMITMYTAPLAPFGLKIVPDTELYTVDLKTARSFCDTCGLSILPDQLSHKRPGYLHAVYNELPVKIALNEAQSPIGTSSLVTFSLMKKLTRYLTESALWLYSAYVQSKPVSEWSTESLANQFLQAQTVVRTDFIYPVTVSAVLSRSTGLYADSKLVFTSLEAQKKMGYVLRLAGVREIKLLQEYYKEKIMRNFYLDLGDFDKYPQQVILQGKSAVVNWIDAKKRAPLTITDQVNSKVRGPYFFRNVRVGKGEVYLTENLRSLKRALSTALQWKRSGYLDSDIDDRMEFLPQFTLYSYRSATDVTVYYIEGDREPGSELEVIGFRESGETFYSPLLKV